MRSLRTLRIRNSLYSPGSFDLELVVKYRNEGGRVQVHPTPLGDVRNDRELEEKIEDLRRQGYEFDLRDERS